MKNNKAFIHNICRLFVKLFCVVICCNLLVCCVVKDDEPISPPQNHTITSESAININTASADELEKLPGVGEKRARRIVEHREKFGKFRRLEHILLVEGFGDGHFREMRMFVKVE